jgi:hypothetical protein
MANNKPFDWKPVFLEALRNVPVVRHACEVAGIGRTTAYEAREAGEAFAKAWDEALEEGIDRAEQEAFRRAVVGFEEPVLDKGRLAYRYERYEDEEGAEHYRLVLDEHGQPVPLTVRKHSDALLALYLKGRRKAVYAERKELTGADGAALPATQVLIATGVPSDHDFTDLA